MTVAIRIQKYLADLGYGSRRKIEDLIRAEKIFIDGKLATLGDRITGKEQIELDGKTVLRPKEHVTTKVIMYHKPLGEICTRSDPQGRRTIFASLPELSGQRWVAIGRLDINSSGLLLLTNNGDVANHLMHPKGNIEREYSVRVLGALTAAKQQAMLSGVKLSDGSWAKFKRITIVANKSSNSWYRVTLTRGKYREVREIFNSQGLVVNRLIRIRFGDLLLPKSLQPGTFTEVPLTATQLLENIQIN